MCAYIVFNFIVSAATPSGLNGWQMLAPDRDRGMVIAILVSAVTLIGVGLGPPVIGILTDSIFQGKRALGMGMLTLFVTAAVTGTIFAWAGRAPFQARVDRRN
jgi:MFS family permease